MWKMKTPQNYYTVAEVEKKEQEIANLEEYPPELLIKHPLQNTWTLWYYESDRNKTWEESQREIISFDTAEDFWSLYNHIKPASELKHGSDYSMFKQGIRPMWEDDANKHGGRWLMQLEKKQRVNDLDHYWLEILLCMIGEAFNDYSDDVCGAVVNVRTKGDKIGIWTADSSRSQSVMEIGHKLRERLRPASKMPLDYHVHSDTAAKSSSSTKYIHRI